jgi:hypothetical protein
MEFKEAPNTAVFICGHVWGTPVPDASRYCDVNQDVCLREVPTERSFRSQFGYARWFNGGSSFRLLQVVWPDKEGRFPGEAGAAGGANTGQLLP